MPVGFPAHVVCRDFMDDPGNRCEVCSDVMLETVFANVAQQFLHVGNLDDSGAAECFQRIISKASFPYVAADHAVLIVGGKARETHRRGLHLPYASSEGV